MNKAFRTRQKMKINWGPGHTPISSYETEVPAGHPCSGPVRNGDGSVSYFVEPIGLRLGLLEFHDAEHYGIRIGPDDIEPIP